MKTSLSQIITPFAAALLVFMLLFGLAMCAVAVVAPGDLDTRPWLRAASFMFGFLAMTPTLVVDLLLRTRDFDAAFVDRFTGGVHPATFALSISRSQFLIKLWAAAKLIGNNRGYPLSLRFRGGAIYFSSLGSFMGLLFCTAVLVIKDVVV